jgi:S-adenosylmethionine decarboxylase
MLGFGPHLVMDARGCASRRLNDISGLYRLLDELPGRIGMTKIMPPYVFAHGEPGTPEYGLSGFVLIAESHISVHTFVEQQRVTADIFSCEEFDAQAAVDQFVAQFEPKEYTHRVLRRGSEFPRRIDLSRAVVEAQRGRMRRNGVGKVRKTVPALAAVEGLRRAL